MRFRRLALAKRHLQARVLVSPGPADFTIGEQGPGHPSIGTSLEPEYRRWAPVATSESDSPSVERLCCPSFDLDHRFTGGELLRYSSAHRHARNYAVQDGGRYAKHSIFALAATSLAVADYNDARFVGKKQTDGVTVNA